MLIDYPALQPYQARYVDDSAFVPLRIVLLLRPGARLAGYDPLNLDNLLARCVVDEATQGAGLPFAPGAYNLPVPLRCLWRDDEGLPLWAATAFHPAGEQATDLAYWHKRVQNGRFTGTRTGTFAIRSTNGRWMERRVPLPNVVCQRWEASAIGDPAEIARLLAPIGFVGKRRTNGFGEVEGWLVEPAEFALIQDGRLTRPLPAGAVPLLGGAVPIGTASPVGWTPPQWKPALFRPGWWTGAEVEEVAKHASSTPDWYTATDRL